MTSMENPALEADTAAYEALKAELSQPDPELSDLGVQHPVLEDGEAPPQQERQQGAPHRHDEDADRQRRIAEAADQADAWLDQMEAADRSPAPAPNINEDPLGYFEHQLATLHQREVQRDQRDFAQAVHHAEQQMRQSAPDYDDACEHFANVRMAQLEVAYPDDDPRAHVEARRYGLASPAELRSAILKNDHIGAAQMAMSRGQSPAQLLYDLAVRSGYRSGSQSLDMARRGQRATGSPTGRTQPIKGRVTEAKLLQLYETDPEAFDAEWDRYAAAQG